ncbi:MAG: hypothetical protein H0W20_00580 [Chthoniobacterales bacterium]|nr:hypothetical protein [Chthoniobacterales bacterium]
MKYISISKFLIASIALLAVPQLAGAVTTWAQTYGVDATDGSPDGQDFPFAVAAMPDGGAVVIGKLSIPNTIGDGHPKHRDAIVRYNGSGAILWQKALTSTIAGYDSQGSTGFRHANVLADSLGNIFVTSQFAPPGGGVLSPRNSRATTWVQ